MTQTGKAFRVSGRTTSGSVLDSAEVDRRVFVYVQGDGHQRLGFSSDDTYTADSGFLIPSEGVSFVLAAGDPIYLTGQVSTEGTFVHFLVTEVG